MMNRIVAVQTYLLETQRDEILELTGEKTIKGAMAKIVDEYIKNKKKEK